MVRLGEAPRPQAVRYYSFESMRGTSNNGRFCRVMRYKVGVLFSI